MRALGMFRSTLAACEISGSSSLADQIDRAAASIAANIAGLITKAELDSLIADTTEVRKIIHGLRKSSKRSAQT
jgi:hypothetical protein